MRAKVSDTLPRFLDRIGPELAELFRRGPHVYETWADLKWVLFENIAKRLQAGLLVEVQVAEKANGPNIVGATRAQRDAYLQPLKELDKIPF